MCCPAPRYVKDRIPEMNPTAWLNTKPLSPEDFKGKVVLVHFFSFGTEFSDITISHLAYLWSKMKGKGLVVLGVHAPSLESEKDLGFVKGEVERRGIEFPLAIDNDFQVWKAFRNQFFGQSHLVDHLGTIRHCRAGEGIEEEVEMGIVHLLNEAGSKVDLGPEIDGVCLEGHWFVGEGYVELQEAYGNVSLRYISDRLDLVLSSPRKTRFEIKLDGEPLRKEVAGKDVILEGGKSYIPSGKERRLEVVREERTVMRELLIRVRGKGFRFIGFCVEEKQA